MKKSSLLPVLALAAAAGLAQAQVAGSTVRATAVLQVREVASGWSVVRQILGRSVVNEHGQTVGRIDDIIVAPDGAVSHVIVGNATGLLGMHRHVVAVPAAHLLLTDDAPVLVGARPGTLEQMPAFEYAH